ncbi:hypothetical protein BS50DRAFT_572125 [Corynespora cassiicola Philippines]|uniref:Uncharacterized protein n=1 Tax=Corynespora cassiicola Philippines TaxID=1448308 RepID=A0A2T2NU21_CORCC|nr:hypothetical protein BS50DRAFT_572125 [Corynespora cassiicola Philippines]
MMCRRYDACMLRTRPQCYRVKPCIAKASLQEKKKSPTFKDVETGTARRYALFRLQPHLLVAAHLGTVLVFGALTS